MPGPKEGESGGVSDNLIPGSDQVAPSSDHVLPGSDHVIPGSEFLTKPEPLSIGTGGADFPKTEPGLNVVVKEEVLDSNIIPTS